MRLSLRALRYAVAVADHGTVSAAAKKLNVSQPSVSEAVAACEAEFGFPLFVRHHARGVTPTVAGRSVLAEARALLTHAEAFGAQARAMGREPAGEVTLGCFLTVAPRFVPALLAGFARAFPAVTVRLEEADHAGMMAALAEGRTELALGYDYGLSPAVEAEPLARLPAQALLPAGHRLARRARLSLHDLVEEPFLLLDLPISREYFLGLFRAAGLSPRIGFRSRGIEMVRGMVAAGHGWSILNVVPSSPHAADGKRVVALPLEDAVPVRLMLLRPAGRPERPAVAALAGFVRQAFAAGGMFDPVVRDRA